MIIKFYFKKFKTFKSVIKFLTDTRLKVFFGFKEVNLNEKEKLVSNVFSSVAKNYDLMNDIMSMGIHRAWKNYFVEKIDAGMKRNSKLPLSFIDVAGGTGDISFKILDHAQKKYNDNDSTIVVTDINSDMLNEGNLRYLKSNWNNEKNRMTFILQNGETLDKIEDNSKDIYTIAFGLRNFTDIQLGLNTAYRVLKPGGLFACLEFSHVPNAVIDYFYQMYSLSIPLMGQLVCDDRDSYLYLIESIKKFPKKNELKTMIEKSGFKTVGKGYQDLSFGIVSIHCGIKI